MRHPTLNEDWQPWSEVTTGEWCEPCALPSVHTVDWVRSIGRQTLRLTRAYYCDECGRSWVEDLT